MGAGLLYRGDRTQPDSALRLSSMSPGTQMVSMAGTTDHTNHLVLGSRLDTSISHAVPNFVELFKLEDMGI